MYRPVSAGMLLIVLVCSLTLAVMGQQVEDDWIDPYDMLKYDPSTKTMRKPTEVRRIVYVAPTKLHVLTLFLLFNGNADLKKKKKKTLTEEKDDKTAVLSRTHVPHFCLDT